MKYGVILASGEIMEKESMTRAREWLAKNYPNVGAQDEQLIINAYSAGFDDSTEIQTNSYEKTIREQRETIEKCINYQLEHEGNACR